MAFFYYFYQQVYQRRDGGVQGPLRPLDIKTFVIERYNEVFSFFKMYKNTSNFFYPLNKLIIFTTIIAKTIEKNGQNFI